MNCGYLTTVDNKIIVTVYDEENMDNINCVFTHGELSELMRDLMVQPIFLNKRDRLGLEMITLLIKNLHLVTPKPENIKLCHDAE